MDNRAVTFLFCTLVSFLQLFKSTDQTQHSLTQGAHMGQGGNGSGCLTHFQTASPWQPSSLSICTALAIQGKRKEMADAKACTGLQIGLDCTMVYQAGVDPTTTTLDSHSFSPCQMSFYDTGFLHRSHSLSISLHTVQPLWLQRHYTPTHARRQASIRIQTSTPPQGSPVSTRHSTSGCGQKYLLVPLAAHTWMYMPIMCRDSAYSSQHHFSLLLFQASRNSPQTETVSVHYHLDWARL